MIIDKFGCIPFGGDYCPEQWDEDTWAEDLRIMREYGVNTVTLNVHNWDLMNPADGLYDFSFIEKTARRMAENGIRVIMGTGTTAVPNWLGKKYPDMIRTDINGRRHTTGTRESYCVNSPHYRREIRKLVSKLAYHFKDDKNIKLWHMANEVGNVCYCEHCAAAYRRYLIRKFGTLGELNRAWNTRFWGHTYGSWDEIDPPMLGTEYAIIDNIPGNDMHFRPTEAIEYLRFYSESLRECYEIERDAIRSFIPDAVVTNNFQFRVLDYRRVCAASDVIAFDSYPAHGEHPAKSAMQYDICRGLHKPGKPFLMMEMSPNQASWENVVKAKRPGEVQRIAMRGLAHGADSSLFFQIRRNPSGFEKFHGAMIDNIGHGDTRVGRELRALSEKLRLLEPCLDGTTVKAETAVILDFDAMFGVEIPCSLQKHMQYMEEVEYYYRYFNERNIPVDVLPASAELSGYKLVVAPMLYMMSKEFAREIERFVRDGGVLFTTYYSGLADLNDRLYTGGFPGVLRDVCGIWVEDIDALAPHECNHVHVEPALRSVPHDGSAVPQIRADFECGFLCDMIHLEGARALGTYTDDFYAGTPCITENRFGNGTALYAGSKLERAGVDAVLGRACELADIGAPLDVPEGVEVCIREGGGKKLLFLINDTGEEKTVCLPKEWKVLFGTMDAAAAGQLNAANADATGQFSAANADEAEQLSTANADEAGQPDAPDAGKAPQPATTETCTEIHLAPGGTAAAFQS